MGASRLHRSSKTLVTLGNGRATVLGMASMRATAVSYSTGILGRYGRCTQSTSADACESMATAELAVFRDRGAEGARAGRWARVYGKRRLLQLGWQLDRKSAWRARRSAEFGRLEPGRLSLSWGVWNPPCARDTRGAHSASQPAVGQCGPVLRGGRATKILRRSRHACTDGWTC